MFKDRCPVLGAILHSCGPRIVISQPLMRGEAAEPAAITVWMRSLGFVPVGRKTYWNAAEGIAIFDAHPGNVLRIPDGRLCPIDIVPCIAATQMISFMNERVKTWKPKH